MSYQFNPFTGTFGLAGSGGGGTDQLVKISSADTIASFLESKLLAGEGVQLIKANIGANETLTIRKTPLGTEVEQAWLWSASSSFTNITPMNFLNANSGSGSRVSAQTVSVESDINAIRLNGGISANARAAADPSRAMLCDYDSNTSNNFILKTTGPGSASTRTITGVPAVLDQKYKIAIRHWNDAGTRKV